MIFNAEVAVTDEATDCNADPGSTTGGATTLFIANVGGTPVEWGGPDVVFGEGVPIADGAQTVLDNVTADEVFVVAETTGTVRVGYKRNG